MKLKFEVIPASELNDGDIFYCTPDAELNEFGADADLTGTDQIFIKDDYYDHDEDNNYAILVNGGWNIWFRPKEKVVRLGHYSDLIRIIEMVKEGNPLLDLGPNDINTKIEYLIETGHLKEKDLFEELGDIDFDKKSKEDDDEDDKELPF